AVLGRCLRRPPHVDRGTTTLRYRGLVRGAGVVFGLVMVFNVASFIRRAGGPRPTEEYVFGGIGLPVMSFVSACVLRAGFRSRLVLSEGGVTWFPVWGRPVHLPWRDVMEVGCSRLFVCDVLVGVDGRKIRVSGW